MILRDAKDPVEIMIRRLIEHATERDEGRGLKRSHAGVPEQRRLIQQSLDRLVLVRDGVHRKKGEVELRSRLDLNLEDFEFAFKKGIRSGHATDDTATTLWHTSREGLQSSLPPPDAPQKDPQVVLDSASILARAGVLSVIDSITMSAPTPE